MRYKEYHWLHMPTGKTGTHKFSDVISTEPDELQALRLVNEWNQRSGENGWKYWVE